MCVCVERERERETHTETETERDRQRASERERERERESQIARDSDRFRSTHADLRMQFADREIGRDSDLPLTPHTQ